MSLPVSFSYRALLSGMRGDQGFEIPFEGGCFEESVVSSAGGVYGGCDGGGVWGMGHKEMGKW